MARKAEEKTREAQVPPARAAARPQVPLPRAGAKPALPPALELADNPPGSEHRQFPRALMAVRFAVWIGDEGERRFSAALRSVNVSVSGAFLESTFFLPLGTTMRVSFALEEGAAPVEAMAQIVREERPDPRDPDSRSGFGIKFVEFFGQTEVTLAKLFLGTQLRGFAEEYLASKRARSLISELDRVVDALAAWELLKVTTPGDPWRPRVEG